MVTQIEEVIDFVPDEMKPGTIFILEKTEEEMEKYTCDTYWAVLACPECGTLGKIVRKQLAGMAAVLCGSPDCAAEFFIRNDEIVPRKPS